MTGPDGMAGRCPHDRSTRRVAGDVARTAAAILLAAVFFLRASPVTGQGTTIAGHVVDTAGSAVPGLGVVLHRVGDAGGARIADATTDDTGGFSLSSSEAPVPDAVYFVAARVDGQLYIGPFVSLPLGAVAGYTVVVGGEPFDLGEVTLPRQDVVDVGSTASPRRWILAVVPALALVAAGMVAAARLRGPSERRRLLIRVAQLDAEPAPGPSGERDEERARLVERLLSLER